MNRCASSRGDHDVFIGKVKEVPESLEVEVAGVEWCFEVQM